MIFTEFYTVVVATPESKVNFPSAELQLKIHSTRGKINTLGEPEQKGCKEGPKNNTEREKPLLNIHVGS
jgi:hypothetical protein